MALLIVAGDPATPGAEIAQLAAARLDLTLVDDALLNRWLSSEFGPDLPGAAWPAMASSVAAKAATRHHLALAFPHAEMLFDRLPGVLRVAASCPQPARAGLLMVNERLDRAAADKRLAALDEQYREQRRMRFGKARVNVSYDLILNTGRHGAAPLAAAAAAVMQPLMAGGLLSASAEAQLQFQWRMQLARHGIAPAGKTPVVKREFGHPSEETFANLLDFYRIRWEYEPRSFPLQWDKDGNVLEAFTPDFYLPEFDVYIELTTMKQALVTKKNRKVKLLKAIYPHVNIQVFYQKDFQDLVMKFGM